MEAAVRHQTPGAHTRKVACAQAAGLRMNVLLRFPPPQKSQNSPGLTGQTGAGSMGSIFSDFELSQCPVPRAILSALLKLLLCSHPHRGLRWRGREAGRLIDWLGFTAPSLISVGSHCASKKAGFSGRQCSGLYLYPSSCPVAELFTITNSRRTRCLPEGPFSHGIYSRFLWDDLSIHIFLMKGGGGKEKKKTQSWLAQFSGANAEECYFFQA